MSLKLFNIKEIFNKNHYMISQCKFITMKSSHETV